MNVFLHMYKINIDNTSFSTTIYCVILGDNIFFVSLRIIIVSINIPNIMNISEIANKIDVSDSDSDLFFDYTRKWIEFVTSKKQSADISDSDWQIFFASKNPAAGIDRGALRNKMKDRNNIIRNINEQETFKDNWDYLIRPKIEDAIRTKDISEKIKKIKELDLLILDTIKKGGGRNVPVATNRMLNVFFPGLFVRIPQLEKLNEFIVILKKRIDNGSTLTKEDNWIDNSYQVKQFLDRELNDDKLTVSAWKFYNYLKEYTPNDSNITNEDSKATTSMDKIKYDNFLKLLKGNYNLILTGAPGTGKTYLAKRIAEAMGANEDSIKMVQFHPSYDYTDFVEGLRPIEKDEKLGFERKDGVFKEFCKEALRKSAVEPTQALKEFKEDLEISPISIPCFKNTKKYITIKLNDKGELRVFPQRCKTVDGYSCSDKDVLHYLNTGEYDKGHDAYQPSIGEYIKDKYLEKVDYTHINSILADPKRKKKLFDRVYEEIAKDVIDENIKLVPKAGSNSKFTYIVSDEGKIVVTDLGNDSRNEDKKGAPIDKIYVLVEHYLRNPLDWANESKQAFNIIIENSEIEGKSVDYYVWAIVKEMIKRVCNLFPRPYVFIDEINRGEVSKIFGELFYSIESGYRGEKGKVYTQYQNLVPKDDFFYNGFYIPNNVYIIGTMNDIDRSVESMDFAMRRRFAWKEITAKSRQSMLDEDETWGSEGKPSERIIAEMKARMDNLNSAIIDQYGDEELSNKDKVGLTKAYQIGAAYFLKYALYNNFEELWTNHLEGLLYEYLRGKPNIDEKIERLHQAYNDTIAH